MTYQYWMLLLDSRVVCCWSCGTQNLAFMMATVVLPREGFHAQAQVPEWCTGTRPVVGLLGDNKCA